MHSIIRIPRRHKHGRCLVWPVRSNTVSLLIWSNMFKFSNTFESFDKPISLDAKTRVHVDSDNLGDIVQALHDFLLGAGFPNVERVTVSTQERTYASRSSFVDN